MQKKIREYILTGVDDREFSAHSDPFWSKLRDSGTAIWLDTGDIEEAEEVWTSEMDALTTNNTLINKVIQKGIYDDYISRTRELVSSLDFNTQVKEIALILNARHGLRLVKRFGGYVSVELHTDTAHDIDAIVSYGMRYHEINPDRFIIKVPLTSSGLIGARKLKEKGVKINFTLGFSARQNALTVHVARPDYLNVFMGRIGAYIANNNLGDGDWTGEKTVIETQRIITRVREANGFNTRLIAASLRHHVQLEYLAGTDVLTIPPKVASSGRLKLSGNFESKVDQDYSPVTKDDMVTSGIIKFWKVPGELMKLSEDIGSNLPGTGEELERKMVNAGYADMFPSLSNKDLENIMNAGKIPVHATWADLIRNNFLAPDTLLNLAGLASFTADQGELDGRIKSTIG
ncbi:MAG TPA: transaldolase family protein [Bacteroidales bacterium]|nr:transaldolase family protein [Bacteroidales bacterium]